MSRKRNFDRWPRWSVRLHARYFHYFWLPCPLCKREFSGAEWRDVDGKCSSIPVAGEPGVGEGICPECTRAGKGSLAPLPPVPYSAFTHTKDERGDTLLELLIAMTITAIAAVAVMAAFMTAIGASVEQAHLAELNTLTKSYAEVTTADLTNAGVFISCGTPAQYAHDMKNEPTTPAHYTFSALTITYWNGSTFSPTCTAGSTQVQLFTVTATWSNGGTPTSDSLSFAVADYNYTGPA